MRAETIAATKMEKAFFAGASKPRSHTPFAFRLILMESLISADIKLRV